MRVSPRHPLHNERRPCVDSRWTTARAVGWRTRPLASTLVRMGVPSTSDGGKNARLRALPSIEQLLHRPSLEARLASLPRAPAVAAPRLPPAPPPPPLP